MSEKTGISSGINKPWSTHECLRSLQEQGFVFDQCVFTLKGEWNCEERRWRVELWETTHGNIRGVGEGARKALAISGAIVDLAESFRKANIPGCLSPRAAVPLEVKISPRIFLALESVCKRRGLDGPAYYDDIVSKAGKDFVRTTCSIDSMQFEATSYNQKYARLEVALQAYNELSSQPFLLDEPFIGTECSSRNLYELVETEQVHVVDGISKACRPLKRKHPRIICSTDILAYPRFRKLRASLAKRKVENGAGGSGAQHLQRLQNRETIRTRRLRIRRDRPVQRLLNQETITTHLQRNQRERPIQRFPNRENITTSPQRIRIERPVQRILRDRLSRPAQRSEGPQSLMLRTDPVMTAVDAESEDEAPSEVRSVASRPLAIPQSNNPAQGGYFWIIPMMPSEVGFPYPTLQSPWQSMSPSMFAMASQVTAQVATSMSRSSLSGTNFGYYNQSSSYLMPPHSEQ